MKSLAAIFLSLIILLGTMQLRVGMHLCGGELQNIAFFAKAESCSHASKDHHVVKKNSPNVVCCDG